MRQHRMAAQGRVVVTQPGKDRTRKWNPYRPTSGHRWQWFGQSPRGYSVGGKFQATRSTYKDYKRTTTRRADRQAERGHE